MELSFDLINSFLVHPFTGVDDPKLRKNIQAISQNFTKDRNQINQYVENDELVSAYTAFYFPTNFIKLKKLFEMLPKSVVESFADYDVIDVGSGPGTYAAAFLQHFPNFNNQLYLLETSTYMNKQAQKTINHLFPNFNQLKINKQVSGDKKRLIFFGNSLNEIGHEAAKKIIENNKASIVIFIEPGTPQAFAEMLPMRENLINKNFKILYPCPNNSACPISPDSNWCHQIFHQVHHPSIETLSQFLKKDRRTLPVIAHVYSRDHSLEKLSQAIIFRVLEDTKFSFNFEVCANNQILKIEIMKKDYNKEKQKQIADFLAGRELNYTVQKNLNNHIRVLLSFSE